MEEHEKIQLHSEEIQEILGKPPRWIVRSGTTAAFLAFLALLFASYFIRYPDIIEASTTVTTGNPPVDVVAKFDTRLSQLEVAEGQEVNQGDLLVILENAARRPDIRLLSTQIQEQLTTVTPKSVQDYIPARNLQLGEVQPAYTEFLKTYDAYLLDSSSDIDRQKIQQRQAQILKYQERIRLEEEKRGEINERLNLAQREVKRVQGAYSKDPAKYTGQLEDAINARTQAQTELKDLKTNLVNLEIIIDRLNGEIKGIRQQSGQSSATMLVTLEANLRKLVSSIENWRQNYLLFAPVGGQISFYRSFANEQQFVRSGENILTIIPPGGDRVFARLQLPLAGAGKVDTGFVVIIKLKNFPYKEYGVLKGKVESKPNLAQNDTYTIEASLPQDLVTSYGKQLPFSQELKGTAEIITKERRLLQRLFDDIFAFAEDY